LRQLLYLNKEGSSKHGGWKTRQFIKEALWRTASFPKLVSLPEEGFLTIVFGLPQSD
jgi:hypothetical protein